MLNLFKSRFDYKFHHMSALFGRLETSLNKLIYFLEENIFLKQKDKNSFCTKKLKRVRNHLEDPMLKKIKRILTMQEYIELKSLYKQKQYISELSEKFGISILTLRNYANTENYGDYLKKASHPAIWLKRRAVSQTQFDYIKRKQALGVPLKQIADRLGLSLQNVKQYASLSSYLAPIRR